MSINASLAAPRGGAPIVLRALLLRSCCIPALCLPPALGLPAVASAADLYACAAASQSGASCTIPADAVTAGFVELYTGPNATGDDNPDAAAAGAYTLENNAAITSSATGQFGVLALRLRGGQGSTDPDDAGQSGDGGAVTLRNHAAISVRDLTFSQAAGTATDGPSMWNQQGVIHGLYGSSSGNDGVDAREQTIGGGDGGRGGDGGDASVSNSSAGAITLRAEGPATNADRRGMIGILASSNSGSGGQRDTTDGEDPRGGDAGDAKSVSVDNDGAISLCDASSACDGSAPDTALSSTAAAIYAESVSGDGADPTSSGGNAGDVSVTNTGALTVRARVAPGGAAWGVFAGSIAGRASLDSRSNEVGGGAGGIARAVTVTHAGALTLAPGDMDQPVDIEIDRVGSDDYVPGFLRQSGGIVAASVGAAGGASKDGYSGQSGGLGGNAGYTESGDAAVNQITLSPDATVTVTGDNVIGVGVFIEGGDGGMGNSTDSNGGDGGSTGGAKVVLGERAVIRTSGDNAIGVIAHTKGGPGGGVRSPSGLVDFTDNNAGVGGDGGFTRIEGGEGATISTVGDRAIGAVAQSLAGSGGAAKDQYSIIDAGATNGGKGGLADAATMSGFFAISTNGLGAHGALLQSISGGGGDLTSDGGFISVSGSGGQGESGGEVGLDLSASSIVTRGDASAGVVMQSIGGGGGDVNSSGGGSAGVVSVGGQGGPGGAGGHVHADLNEGTSFATSGRFSYGLLMQSIGGGGGNGGDVFDISARLPSAAVGGDGGVGGAGGAVEITTEGTDAITVRTTGDNAHGVLMQSIGGGGGAGGDARSVSFGIASLTAIAMAGGADSAGGGGAVTADLFDLDIATTGGHAKGFVAHSIGGGGGAGGSASSVNQSFGVSTAVAVGGKGGNGGAGGTVDLTFDEVVITNGVAGDPEAGVFDHGIVAQSIGGGGGIGGSGDASSFASQLEIPGTDVTIAIAGAAGVGGSGGSGGAGGTVRLDLESTTVTTYGDGGHGIVMHSIGGGGGAGGDGASLATASFLRDKLAELIPEEEGEGGGEEKPSKPKINISIGVAVGGNGGDGGSGGALDLTLGEDARIVTYGPSADAVLGQSVGGGGGDGGIASAATKKFGEGAGVKSTINVGGKAATYAGYGGNITASLDDRATLTTHGEGGRGLVMQTVGGGGGTSQTTSVSFTSKLTDAIVAQLGGIKAPRLTVGVGMTGGAGGGGGTIQGVDMAGTIETFGADADGVLIQSIGGGGGLGGSFGGSGEAEDGERTPLEFGLELQEIKEQIERPWALNVNVGGAGGSGGNGGNFAVASTQTNGFAMPRINGAVTTHGDYADAVVAQSIGGGGGAGGASTPKDSIGFLDLSLRVGGTGGSGGRGGQVGVQLAREADIATSGIGAHGVIAQSIGGGGGMGGTASRQVGNLGLDAGTTAPPPDGDGNVLTNNDPAFELLDPEDLYGDENETLPAAVIRLGIGSGGAGGAGASANRAEVNATNGARIVTSGFNAFGVAVQSVGGGGGMGGVGSAPLTAAELALDNIDPDDRQPFVDNFNALFRGAHLDFIAGGDGNKGGDGGAAVAQGVFDVTTSGPRSVGIAVQSVGGGGGMAGLEGSRLLRSGSDGTNGSGGAVRITLDGGSAVTTSGIGSHAVLAQSVAGGGGMTASTLAYGSALRRYDADLPPTEAMSLAFQLGLGAGSGTGLGTSATATLDLSGAIVTSGFAAYGAIAQSIGGGGGVVSLTPAEIDRTTTTTVSSGEVTLGSTASCPDIYTCSGAGNVAVTLSEDATILTTGAGARGLVAQTVQFGGGVASGFELLQRPSAGEATDVSLSLKVVGDYGYKVSGPSTLDFAGSVTTLGADADGVLFQAIGGGGGVMGSAGGATVTLDDQGQAVAAAPVTTTADGAAYDMTISLGNVGPVGGNQNNAADIELSGAIVTYGDFAEAAIAQSISGGGGVAGLSVDPTSAARGDLSILVGADGTNYSSIGAFDGTSGVGGFGSSGVLTATLSGAYYITRGYAANGLVLQQIQGGGGIAASGGRSVRAVKETLSDGTKRHGLTVGGNYGDYARSAGLVAEFGGGSEIYTTGAAAHGAVVQNIVGGGGIGALGTSLRGPNGETAASVIDVTLGGFNTTGTANVLSQFGNGRETDTYPVVGDLRVDYADTSIQTDGAMAAALVVQSVGGGGGVGVAPSDGVRNLSLGVSDGQYGFGGLVTLDIGGEDPAAQTYLRTSGLMSRAMVVQTLSSGGGLFSGTANGADWIDGATARLGATGGTLGDGGRIEGDISAEILTSGLYADALVLQAIAGGGGIADFAGPGQSSANLALALGQSAGQGTFEGRDDAIEVALTDAAQGGGSIVASGDGGMGLVAQAIGGGGGLLTYRGAGALAPTITLGATAASGDQTGGGIRISFADSNPDTPVFDTFGRIATYGSDGHAIVLQSIGGGGGIARLEGVAADGGGAQVRLGAAASGHDASADEAILFLNAPFSTAGDRAIGVLVQSIGGGGGLVSAGAASVIHRADLGSGGGGGVANGGNAYAEQGVTAGCKRGQPGTCSFTTGEGAHGMVAQSIGGGGGIVGDVSFADGVILYDYDPADATDPGAAWDFGGKAGRGAGGKVVAAATSIFTTGAGAYGIVAQSIGGGGGIAGFEGGTFAGKTSGNDAANAAARVSVRVIGAVQATGENSAAIFAQSLGDVIDTQNLQITLTGTVTGGSGDHGVGVLAHGGNGDNRLRLKRGTLSALSGVAVRYQGATNDENSNLKITNRGTIQGSIEAKYRNGEVYLSEDGSAVSLSAAPGRPAATLVNAQAGVLEGASVYEADVENRGVLHVGAAGETDRLAVAGDFVQTETGRLMAVIDPLGRGDDRLAVAGDAQLAGRVQVTPLSVMAGVEHRLLEVGGRIRGRFEDVSSTLFGFDQTVDGGGLVLTATEADIDQAGFDLDPHQAEAARYLEGIFNTGDTRYAAFFGGLDAAAAAGAASLGGALSSISPGASLAGEAATFELSRDRFDALLGCDAPGARAVGLGKSCLRMLGTVRSLDQDGSGGGAGYEGEVWTTGFIGQTEFAPGWRVSGGVGYEQSNLNGKAAGGSVDGGAGFAGVAVTHDLGALSLGVAAMLGYAEFETDRATPFAAGNAKAEHGALSYGVRARASWLEAFGWGYLRPSLDLDLIRVDSDGYDETGAGALALHVSGAGETAFVATPSLEAGTTRALGDGLSVRAWGRAGVSLSTLDSYATQVRFANDLSGAPGFASDVAMSNVVGRIAVGVTVMKGETVDFGLGYQGAFSNDFAGHAATATLTIRF